MPPKVIALTNQKGGCAKTTTTVNLGAFLAELGQKILVVDLDPQGNASSGLGVEKHTLETTIYDVLMSTKEDVFPAVIHKSKVPNLDIIPANIHLSGVEIELATVIGRESRLKDGLSHESTGNYDFILVDTPPSLGLLTLNALTACKYVVIPVQTEFYALEGISLLLNTIQLVKQRLNPELEIMGVALTMFDKRTNLSKLVADEVRNYFQDKVYESVIPRNVALSEAPSHGEPVSVYDPKSKGARAYYDLANEVLASARAIDSQVS